MPTHDIVPHISWHALPCHMTTKKYADFPSMVIFQLLLRKFRIQTWFCNCQQYLCLFRIAFEYTPGTHALVFFGLLTGSPDRLSRRTPGRTPFHPKQTLCEVTFQRARPLPATPFQCPRSRTATLGQGPQHLSCPDVGLIVHRAVSVRRGTTGR